MEVLSFENIKSELIDNFRKKSIIPVIGSGFTKNCKSYNGFVPAGEDYRLYMIKQIEHNVKLADEDIKSLENEKFSSVSSLYHEYVPKENRQIYLRNNFTRVSVEEYKSKILSLPWLYIYTLNIDDGIENCSDYNTIIYANRPVNESIFNDYKCVIKLHGDVNDMLKYSDSESEIFTQEQYIESLKKNSFLLNKLKHDSICNNLLFIGCSLEDEIDLSIYFKYSSKNINSKYLFTCKEPTILDKNKFERYGITHCVIFDTYEDMYAKIYEVGLEAQKITKDDIDLYCLTNMSKLSSEYDKNKSYLLFGKSLINKDKKVILPYYFISRTVIDDIIKNMGVNHLQVIVGRVCSGKSYLLIDIADRIKNKAVFLFESKERLNDSAFEKLINKRDCVLLFDSNFLSKFQVEKILDNLSLLKDNNVNIIICANKSDRDLLGTFKLYEIQDKISKNTISLLELKGTFNSNELEKINPLLASINAGIFTKNKTILDNIIQISDNLNEKNKYCNITLKLTTVHEIAAVIALVTERKIYSSKAIQLDLLDEIQLQYKQTKPFIDYELTWPYEKSPGDNSQTKYVVNAEYWICSQLEKFANNENNHSLIVESYKYIVAKLITNEGSPQLLHNNKNSLYKNYILFDNINRIFCFNKFQGAKGLKLIRLIYDSLNDFLSVDPNYMHQRAKCYIKTASYEDDKQYKLNYLEKAYRDANVAYQIFEQRYNNFCNDKLLISIAHVVYTQALILCHKCFINDFINIEYNTQAVIKLYEALLSPYNSYEYVKNDSFNDGNIVLKVINKIATNLSLINSDAHDAIKSLFNITISN